MAGTLPEVEGLDSGDEAAAAFWEGRVFLYEEDGAKLVVGALQGLVGVWLAIFWVLSTPET